MRDVDSVLDNLKKGDIVRKQLREYFCSHNGEVLRKESFSHRSKDMSVVPKGKPQRARYVSSQNHASFSLTNTPSELSCSIEESPRLEKGQLKVHATFPSTVLIFVLISLAAFGGVFGVLLAMELFGESREVAKTPSVIQVVKPVTVQNITNEQIVERLVKLNEKNCVSVKDVTSGKTYMECES